MANLRTENPTVTPPIAFQAQVWKVQTLVDGGIRLTLDLIAADSETMVALINAREPGLLLEVAAIVVDANE